MTNGIINSEHIIDSKFMCQKFPLQNIWSKSCWKYKDKLVVRVRALSSVIPGSESWLCCLLTWSNYLSFTSLVFIICKHGNSLIVVRIKRGNVGKILAASSRPFLPPVPLLFQMKWEGSQKAGRKGGLGPGRGDPVLRDVCHCLGVPLLIFLMTSFWRVIRFR